MLASMSRVCTFPPYEMAIGGAGASTPPAPPASIDASCSFRVCCSCASSAGLPSSAARTASSCRSCVAWSGAPPPPAHCWWCRACGAAPPPGP
eukprot:356609-Chlamydomonas_euryale.AAC.6